MRDFFAASLGPRQSAQSSEGAMLDWSSLLAPEAPRTAEGWTIPEAFVAVLFAAVTCDGELAAVEHEELMALVHRSRALKSLTSQQLVDINVKVAARLRDSDTALREACEALPEDMRLPLFAHALDLILADGELMVDEADFLNSLIQYLELGRDGVARVANVISLKNRF